MSSKSTARNPTPVKEDDVLRRMLTTPHKPHEVKPEKTPVAKKKAKAK